MIAALLALAGELVLVVWLATALFWGVAGSVLASWSGRSPWLGAVLGAALPVVGPLGLLLHSAVRRPGRRAGRRVPPRRRRVALPVRSLVGLVGFVLAAAVAVVTGLEDTQFRWGSTSRLSVSIGDVGLSLVATVTVLAVAAGALSCWWRPNRLAALAVAWCASWWVLWCLAALLVGDTLRLLVGVSGLTGSLDATVHVGASWTLLLGTSVLLLVWSVTVVLLTHGRTAAPRPRSSAQDRPTALPAPREPAELAAVPAAAAAIAADPSSSGVPGGFRRRLSVLPRR